MLIGQSYSGQEAWAVCPKIDITDLNQKLRYFPSKRDADLNLDYPLDLEQPLQRWEDDGGVQANWDVHSSITRREMGFVAYPVVRRAEPSGPLASESLSQFLQRDGEPGGPNLKFADRVNYEVENALTRKGPAITCCLGSVWEFERIDDAGLECSGHKLNGHLDTDPRILLFRVLLDLDRALDWRFGRQLPTHALSAFWTSWQVQRHLADFCHRAIRARGGDVCIDSFPFVMALQLAAEKLVAYAHELQLSAIQATEVQPGVSTDGRVSMAETPRQEGLQESPPADRPRAAPSKRVTVQPPKPINVQEIRRKMEWADMGLAEEDWAEWEALPESPFQSGDMIAGRIMPPDPAVAHPHPDGPLTEASPAGDPPDAMDSAPAKRGGRPPGIPVNGKKLRELRELANLTQQALAEYCERSQDTIQRGERGDRWDSKTFEDVATILTSLTKKRISSEDLQDRKN